MHKKRIGSHYYETFPRHYVRLKIVHKTNRLQKKIKTTL